MSLTPQTIKTLLVVTFGAFAVWIAAPGENALAQRVVQCHSGGQGTIEECRERDAQSRNVRCRSGGTGTIEECRARDARTRTVRCHSGGSGTIEECRERDRSSRRVECRSGGRGTIEECRERDAQARQRGSSGSTDSGGVLPAGPGRISAGYFDRDYLRSENRQHLGIDTLAAAGSRIASPINGEVVTNRTDASDVMQAYLVIRASNGEEHVFGHISSSLNRGDRVRTGDEIGRVRSWPGQSGRSHVHWGVNRNGVAQAMSGSWGWGRAPADATREDAARRGWRNP